MPDNPHRVQLRRVKGWRMPPNTVKVARPSRWGNPFRVDIVGQGKAVTMYRLMMLGRWWELEHRHGVGLGDIIQLQMLRNDLTERLGELRGKHLACFCPLEDERGNRVPCHADVLLELANREAPK